MLTNRWSVLALLFVVRIAMGFQFQAVPAMAPLFLNDFAVTVADLGLLIGLYHAPGIVFALPGGALGRFLGDKRTVLLGLGLMTIGGVITAYGETWALQIIGRVVAGIGGILLNVLMSKIVADWFTGRELATAMAIFVNSWPVGIALSLLVMPVVAFQVGLQGALLAVVLYLVAAGVAFAVLYQPAPLATPAARPAQHGGLAGSAVAAVLVAGLIWGLFNAALAMIFGFAPLMLSERGWTMPAASSATSIVLWLVAISVPLGGLIADRTGRPLTVLLASALVVAVLLVVGARADVTLVLFILLGLVAGMPAGPIMSLPMRVLTTGTRAVGMGLFFTVFYICQLGGPWLAGRIAKSAGRTSSAFDLGAAMLILAVILLGLFLLLERRVAQPSRNS